MECGAENSINFVNLRHLFPYYCFNFTTILWKAVLKYDCNTIMRQVCVAFSTFFFLRLICIVHFSFIHSLLMLCFTPYCDYTIGYLFICLLIDVWIVPLLKLYPVLQWTFLYLSPGGHFKLFWGIHLGELLNHKV